MPEIHNPNFESRTPGNGADVRSLLSFLLLAILLVFGLQYLHHRELTLPASGSQNQSRAVRTEIAEASLPASQGQPPATRSEFGWLTFIAEPLYLVLRFLYSHGIGNWGWSIIVLTVIFNLLIVWPRVMSMKSSLKMMRIQPKVEALKKRYAHLKLNDPKRSEMNAEMMALYKAEGANMFGGCLPMLLQMPLLFAYMSVLRNATELHHAQWLWLSDLASPDPMHILPLLIIGSMVLTQSITPTPSMSSSQRWMFAVLMPAIWGFSLWHYASGLSLYWVTGNMFNLLVQVAINCSALGKEVRALARERAGAD